MPTPARLPSSTHRGWAVPLAAVGLLIIAAVLAAAIVPSTAFVTKRPCLAAERDGEVVVCTRFGAEEAVQFSTVPADAEPVAPRMSITGVQQYKSAGEIYFVTVREPELSLLDWFVLRENPAAALHSYREVYGDNTPQQQTEQGYQMMRTAKETAEYVAFTRAGIPGTSLDDGPPIVDNLCLEPNEDGRSCKTMSPAADVLKKGDQITAVDGQAVALLGDLTPIMKGHQPGDHITVTVKRDDKEQTVPITTIDSPGDPGRTIIGFIAADTRQIHLPDGINVDISTEHIGGPSAGTAFALTLLDALTPGSLMGTAKVAVTGTIDVDGHVGAIGGLASKASAVKQVGLTTFIVPAAQGPDDIAHTQRVVGDAVKLIPVETLDEAITVLGQLGGDPLPAPPAPPTT